MSIVPSVMQVLGFETQEPAHPFEPAMGYETLSLESAEQLSGIEYKQAFGRGYLWQDGEEPIYGCLDGFRFEVSGRGRSKTESFHSRGDGALAVLTRCHRGNRGR